MKIQKFINCKSVNNGDIFTISEAWCEKSSKEVVHGFWINLDKYGNIYSHCTLGKLLKYYDVDNVMELVGLDVKGHSDGDGHIVLSTFDK